LVAIIVYYSNSHQIVFDKIQIKGPCFLTLSTGICRWDITLSFRELHGRWPQRAKSPDNSIDVNI